MTKIVDVLNKRFGRLSVIERVDNNKHGQARWRCRCDCGNEVIVTGYKLTSGHTRSCGCLKIESTGNQRRTHGDTGSRLYVCWQHMKNRCNNPLDKYFCNYGGRGISVCPEWDSYEKFKEWAFAHGYRDDLTLDRIDVNGNYCPENCRWTTMQEQQNNRRNNHYVEFCGEVHTLADWARIIGINRDVLQMRINKLKWSVEKAFTTPVRNCGRNVENKA